MSEPIAAMPYTDAGLIFPPEPNYCHDLRRALVPDLDGYTRDERPAAQSDPGDECAPAICGDGIHWVPGPRTDDTNEDIEAGPCPRWSDTGSATVAVFLGSTVIFGLLVLAVLGGQPVMCAIHTTPGDRPIYCEPAEAQR